MRLKFKLFTVFFLLLAASAWAGKWNIDGFDDSPDPGDPDKYIEGDLNPIKPGQVSQQSNVLYVRQKFEDTFGDEGATYQIFKGRPTAEAKSLGKISVDGIPYGTLLKMKLFYKRNATGDDDLETVYFDGKDILVEGSDPVYINLNGKMEELKPVVLMDFKVSITSEPEGATVTIGGVNKGSTPLTFNLASQKTVTAIITKDGYYTTVKPITPSNKQMVQEGVSLVARKSLDNPATAYKAKVQAAGSNSNTLKNLRADVKKTLDNYNSDSKKNIEAVLSKYPANPPKASEESSNDYSARQTIWSNAQAKERETLNKESLGIFNELKDLLAEIDATSGGMDFALRYEYIPSNAISIVNMGVKDFTINADVQNSRVKFNYSKAKLSYGSVSRAEIEDDQENVHGVLKIWDKPNENGKYASIYDIAFFFDETPLKVLSKGSFTLSEATSKSRDTEKDLNNRVAKHPGKAEWDKKDETATMQALRSGEIPDPYAKKAPTPSKPQAKPAKPADDDDDDDAEYDEDEDEDEVEKGVAAQEKYDYSKYGATGNATQIFGNTDEYLFWTGMAFLAGALGTGVVGVLQMMKWRDAKEAVDVTESERKRIKGEISAAAEKVCSGQSDIEECVARAIRYAEGRNPYTGKPETGITNENAVIDGRPLWIIDQHLNHNKEVASSYKRGWMIFLGGAAVSLGISITLFAW